MSRFYFGVLLFLIYVNDMSQAVKCDLFLCADDTCLVCQQIPSIIWIFHHSLHFCIYYIVSFVPEILCQLYCYYKYGGLDRGLVDSYHGVCVCEGTGGKHYFIVVVLFYLCFWLLFSHVLCLFFKWLEHDSCCVCFFVSLFSLFVFPWTRSYYA